MCGLNGLGIRWVTIRKASLRNSSVGEGDLRNLGMRTTWGCLARKLLKRGVMSVMFGDCEVPGILTTLSVEAR